MQTKFDENAYSALLERIYSITPSVQAVGFSDGAYKPGLEGMQAFGERLGRPWEKYRCIHVAGTNGKGSVASMLAAAIAGGSAPAPVAAIAGGSAPAPVAAIAGGSAPAPIAAAIAGGSAPAPVAAAQGAALRSATATHGPAQKSSAEGTPLRHPAPTKVGLYTSPHLVDFRERMKVVTAGGWTMPSKEEVWEFFQTYLCDSAGELDTHSLSFFEMTTGLAFWWFARQGVDWAVIEAGLGGRLDSTNIISPELSVVTSIGLDHCALLGSTREAIAYEKAGIFKPGVPALVASEDAETAPVFREAAARVDAPLFFADSIIPLIPEEGTSAASRHPAPELPTATEAEILSRMDLRGPCQERNLHTVLVALDILGRLEEISGKSGEFSETSGGGWHENGQNQGRSSAETGDLARKGPKSWKVPLGNVGPGTKTAEIMEGPVISGGTFHENGPERGRSGQKSEDLPRKEAKTWKVGVVLKGPSTLKAIERTAELTGLRGRWERLCDKPEVVCDIAHNPPALEVNFARLRELQRGNAAESAGSGQRAESAGSGQSQGRPLIIVYGIMADKDLAGIAPLMPEGARFILAAPAIPRALPAEDLRAQLVELRPDLTLETAPSIAAAVERALEIAESLAGSAAEAGSEAGSVAAAGSAAAAGRSASEPFIYIGGSTFVVTEAIEYFNARKK